MDRLRVLAKRRSCSASIPVNVNCSYLHWTQLFLFTSNWTVLYTSNSNCSHSSNSNCLIRRTQLFLLHRTQSVLLNSAASLLNSIRGSFYFAYLLHENSRQWPFHQCILRDEFRYFVLCILFKNVTVSCIKSLHGKLSTLHYSATLSYCCAY